MYDFLTLTDLRLWLLHRPISIFGDAFHIGFHTTVVMIVMSWVKDSFWYRLIKAIILIKIDKLGGGYFVIKMIENFLSIIAVYPWAVLTNLWLLSLNPKRAVTSLCAFHLLHNFSLLFIEINVYLNFLDIKFEFVIR